MTTYFSVSIDAMDLAQAVHHTNHSDGKVSYRLPTDPSCFVVATPTELMAVSRHFQHLATQAGRPTQQREFLAALNADSDAYDPFEFIGGAL